jgi:multidrug efflux pump subunit AcrB
MMFVTKLNAAAVVLLALCAIAKLTPLQAAPPQQPDKEGAADPSADRLFVPDQTLMYVNFYSTAPQENPFAIGASAYFFALDIMRMDGICRARSLGDPVSVMRFLLNPERMRAHKVSSNEVKGAVRQSRMIIPGDWLGEVQGRLFPLQERELILVGSSRNPEIYGEIILRASPQGDILRFKDVARVELVSKVFDISSDVDGHPAATIVAKRSSGSNPAEVIASVMERLQRRKNEAKDVEADGDSWPAEMEFEVIPFESSSLIYAVIEAPSGAAADYASTKCRELRVVAQGIPEIASVTSLLGYRIRTESGASNAATCLIHLKAPSDRKLTPSQINEKLAEKCRTKNIHVAFYEPPAVLAFVTNKGFSVRVMGKAKFNNKRPGGMSEAFMDELLNRKDLANLFTVLARRDWPYELIIDNDVAMQKNIAIAGALENLAKVVGGDAGTEQRFEYLVEALSHSSFKNDRGELVPYRLFMRLRNKLGLKETDH